LDISQAAKITVAGETIQTAANTAIVIQIVITIVLSASLKSMWNLMNVI